MSISVIITIIEQLLPRNGILVEIFINIFTIIKNVFYQLLKLFIYLFNFVILYT